MQALKTRVNRDYPDSNVSFIEADANKNIEEVISNIPKHHKGLPLNRTRPTVYFVNSMSDLFHEEIPDEYIRQVFDVIRKAPQHTFQVLTKRAERMATFFDNYSPPCNAWLGVTVENKKHGLPRLNFLRRVPAFIRFVSVEPMREDLGKMNLDGVHWVIVGGEPGPKARPMKQEWVLNVKRQCEQEKVAFFFKQWGGWGADGKKRAKKHNGRFLEGRTWDAVPVGHSYCESASALKTA